MFNADGQPIARLRPGMVVVPGTTDEARKRLGRASKRLRDYADKAIRPEEDK